MLKLAALGLFAACAVANAADYFPLKTGNIWTYRASTGETFEISVGPLATKDGKVYYRVFGYAAQPLWVRGAERVLYWLNEEFNRDDILADFHPLSGAYNTPIGGTCEHTAQAQERPAEIDLGGYHYDDTLEIKYRVTNCADAGIDRELYLENIGLVQRVNHTIAGPRSFNLVSAKIGGLSFDAQPNVRFSVSLSTPLFLRTTPSQPVNTEVTIRLQTDRTDPIHLRFATSQRYDIAVKDEAGNVVDLWSSRALFLQVVGEEDIVFKEYRVPLSLNLRDGRYQVEAWLTTDASTGRKFAATAPLTVQTVDVLPAAAAARNRR